MKIAITGTTGVGKSTLAKQIKEELMRVTTTGTVGVGKTTLSKHLAGRIPEYKYLQEAAFEAYQAGFKLNEKTPMIAQLWIACKQVELEQRSDDNWVSDRCLIDTLAYTKHFFPKDTALLNVMERIAKNQWQKYDLIIYLPAGEFPIEDDGFRSTSTKFQQDTDQKIQEVLTQFKIPHHRVTGSREERFEFVKQLLR